MNDTKQMTIDLDVKRGFTLVLFSDGIVYRIADCTMIRHDLSSTQHFPMSRIQQCSRPGTRFVLEVFGHETEQTHYEEGNQGILAEADIDRVLHQL